MTVTTSERSVGELEVKEVVRSYLSRRVEERLPAVEDHLWMQWLDREEYLGCSARLVNVSRGGAMFTTAASLRVNQIVNLFLEFAEPQVGVKALVLGILEGKRRIHQVRVSFPQGCPDDFHEAAALGFENWMRRKKRSER